MQAPRMASFLSRKQTYYLLLTVGLLLSVVLFYISRNTISGDHYTYLNYVKGLQQGRYSYWYFLKDYIPDTFRNPGYPVFLYLLDKAGLSLLGIRIVQLLILWATIFLMMKLIGLYHRSLMLRNIFLLLMILNFIALTYPAFIYPETLMMFIITLVVYIEMKYDESWAKVIALSLLYAICFQLRPVILFLPFLRFLYFLYHHRKLSLLRNSVFMAIFLLSLLPYGLWNLKHHHRFKITPIEGGAGAMYLGYWSPRMVNHMETKYWMNVMYRDMLINFATEKEAEHNVQLFNSEWDSIERICSVYETRADSANIAVMKKYPDLFVTHNTEYTLAREQLMTTLAVRHYLADWPFTLKLKVYTFFRLWYTGLDAPGRNISPVQRLEVIIAFISTATVLSLFIFYFLYCLLKKRAVLKALWLPLLCCLYFDLLHLPFVIQSRYTMPVRLLYTFCLAYMMFRVHTENRAGDAAEKH